MERDNAKIYTPLSTAQKYFVGADTVHAWAFKADPEKMGDAQTEAEGVVPVLGSGRALRTSRSRLTPRRHAPESPRWNQAESAA